MTPQDIRERTFEKAVFGGYDMAGVDDFMEEAAAALENAQRESTTLKAKLKVLVDKIEEYRASEDAMRKTLLSAQTLSTQIEAEARERADKLVADAQAKAEEILGDLQRRREAEEQRLEAARRALERTMNISAYESGRLAGCLRILTDRLDSKNFYAFNPSFDKK